MERYQIAIYIRLSKEDDKNKKESNSITTQRMLLEKYAAEHFANYDLLEFCDDGYTGTNFERPGIQNLLQMVKESKINCIIVKDFSRFARDYIELGSYLEQIFPFMGVRFISINDHYDSEQYQDKTADIDVNFKNLLYDLYSKDLSQKVRTSLAIKKENGQYVSSNCPFGYEKSPQDRHQLVIAEDEAKVVRRIFSLTVEGYSSGEIARMFNQEGVKTPIEFKIAKGRTSRTAKGECFLWSHSSICAILRNKVYIGHIVQHKYTKDFVGGKNHLNPKEDWIISYHHHEPIIDEETFEKVQKMRGKKQNIQEVERRTNNLPLQMRGALSDGNGGFLCQLEMQKLQLTSSEAACVHEQVAKADCECPLYTQVGEVQARQNVHSISNEKYDNTFSPFIEMDLRRNYDIHKKQHPLIGKVVCGCCKRNLSYRKSANPYFECRYRYRKDCVESVNVMFLEQYILFQLQEKLIQFEQVQVHLGGLGRREHQTKHDKFFGTSLSSAGDFILEGDCDSLQDEIRKQTSKKKKIIAQIELLKQKNFELYQEYIQGNSNEFHSCDIQIKELEAELARIEDVMGEWNKKYITSRKKNMESTQSVFGKVLVFSEKIVDKYIEKITIYDEKNIIIQYRGCRTKKISYKI